MHLPSKSFGIPRLVNGKCMGARGLSKQLATVNWIEAAVRMMHAVCQEKLFQHLLHDMPVNVCQAAIGAVVPYGELLVIDS